ncbi:hypothetical protein GQ457_15G006400 [Hibiscus cannabinus]
MEPSKTYSSESGWTMYIGSSVHGGSDDGHSEKAAADDDQSDDSMVSDASSGPRHQTRETRGCSLEKRGKKSMEKQKPETMKNKQDKEGKKQTPLKAKRASSDPCPTVSNYMIKIKQKD